MISLFAMIQPDLPLDRGALRVRAAIHHTDKGETKIAMAAPILNFARTTARYSVENGALTVFSRRKPQTLDSSNFKA